MALIGAETIPRLSASANAGSFAVIVPRQAGPDPRGTRHVPRFPGVRGRRDPLTSSVAPATAVRFVCVPAAFRPDISVLWVRDAYKAGRPGWLEVELGDVGGIEDERRAEQNR